MRAFTLRWVLLLALLTGLPRGAGAQDTLWTRRYNGTGNSEDIPTAVAVDSAGNVYVTGQSYGQGNAGNDFLTIKYSPQGDSLWVRRWDGIGNGDDHPQAIALDRWGNVYVAGWTGVGGGVNYNYETIKYRPNGDTAWTQSYDGPAQNDDYGRALVLDSQGNPIVTGWSYVIGTYASFDIVTLKYDTSGALLWSADYDGPGHGYDRPNAILRDDSDQVYITGTSSDIATGYDYVILKYDAQLRLLWARRYLGMGGDGDDLAQGIVQGPSGNLYVSGYSHHDTTGYNWATLKYTPAGDTLWVRRYHYPSSGDNYVTALALDSAENVLITGYVVWPGNNPTTDYLTVKYDSSGNLLWVRLYNGPFAGDDQPSAIAVDRKGDAIVTGWSQGTTMDYDYATLLYDPAGTQRWLARYDDGLSGNDQATALTVDRQGFVYVTGGSWGEGTGTDYLTIKYLPQLGVEQFPPRQRGREELAAWPNPMRNLCRIKSSSPVGIYDILGRKVRELFMKNGGEVAWDGRNAAGVPVPSGIYFIRNRDGVSRPVTLLR